MLQDQLHQSFTKEIEALKLQCRTQIEATEDKHDNEIRELKIRNQEFQSHLVAMKEEINVRKENLKQNHVAIDKKEKALNKDIKRLKSDQDMFNKRIEATINDNKRTTNTKLVDLSSRLKDAQTAISNARLDDVVKEITRLGVDLATAETKINAITKKLEDANTKESRTSTTLVSISTSLESYKNQSTTLKTRLNKATARLENVENVADKLTTDVSTVETMKTHVEERVACLAEKVDMLQGMCEAMDKGNTGRVKEFSDAMRRLIEAMDQDLD